GHLVTVEVGVECRGNEWVQLNCRALDKSRLECLNTEAVQGGSAVEEDVVVLNHFFQYLPHNQVHTLHQALGALDIVCEFLIDQAAHNKRLEEFKRHSLWQTPLVKLKVRTDLDHGAAGVVNTLTEQVLAESPLLTLKHVAQALELVLAGAGNHATAASVVD